MKIEEFDKIKDILMINSKIDIIVENLVSTYLLDDTVMEDNMNLYGTSKDLFV